MKNNPYKIICFTAVIMSSGLYPVFLALSSVQPAFDQSCKELQIATKTTWRITVMMTVLLAICRSLSDALVVDPIEFAQKHDYSAFYKKEIEFRRDPYGRRQESP